MKSPRGITERSEHHRSGSKRGRRYVLLFAALVIVYSANGRDIGAADAQPTMMLAVSLARGDGLVLDRYFPEHLETRRRLPYWAAYERGHIVSRYPVGAALLALPFTFPQVLILDSLRPGWDAIPAQTGWYWRAIGKNSATLIAALTAIVILYLLHSLELGRAAMPATLVVALGSPLWTIASQSLWQHGPVALALACMLALLHSDHPRPWQLCLAGFAAAASVWFRPTSFIFAAPIFLTVVWLHRRSALWFLPFPLILGAALLIYNYWYFQNPLGGYAELLAYVGKAQAVQGAWSDDWWSGASGTLFSPSRGLFIFCPWIVVALFTLPATASRIARRPVIAIAVAMLLPFFAVLAKQSTWWAGWTYGPRYWTDTLPLFAIVLGYGISWSLEACRPILVAFAATAAVAISIQGIGALCYPSSWAGHPTNIAQNHARLWDWRDTEVTRCLKEGIHPPDWWQWVP